MVIISHVLHDYFEVIADKVTICSNGEDPIVNHESIWFLNNKKYHIVNNIDDPIVNNMNNPLVKNVDDPFVNILDDLIVNNVIDPFVNNMDGPTVNNVDDPFVNNINEDFPHLDDYCQFDDDLDDLIMDDIFVGDIKVENETDL